MKDDILHTHITAEHKLLDLKLKEVWRYRDLIVLFTKRTFAITYKQTVLGPAWLFLNPFITSIIYTIVFAGIAGISTDGIPQILFYLCSQGIWAFFANCVNRNAQTFTSNASIFGKVYFPRLTVPISNILVAAIQFCIQMAMIGAFLAYYVITGAVHPHWWFWILIPIVLLHLGIIGLGFGIIVSSLTTKYRDLSVLVTFGVQLWMYATPIVYPLSLLGQGRMRQLMLLNPVTAPVELFRYAVLGKGVIEIPYLIWSWTFAVLVILVGILIFNKVEKTFMDTV